jgi:hypothetical protein
MSSGSDGGSEASAGNAGGCAVGGRAPVAGGLFAGLAFVFGLVRRRARPRT